MSGFVPGLELCHNFYEEVVAPAVGAPHGAALLGPGSDVLGYDTERSTDHDWGPRCQLFVHASDLDEVRSRALAFSRRSPRLPRGGPSPSAGTASALNHTWSSRHCRRGLGENSGGTWTRAS